MTSEQNDFALLLMEPPNSAAYKYAIAYIVFKTIQHNKNVTIGKLCLRLYQSHMLSRATVLAALSALCSQEAFNCVHAFRPKGHSESGTYLKVSDRADLSWLESVECMYPALKLYEPQAIQAKGAA